MPPKLKDSFEEFGFENHQKIILLECSVDELPKWERFYQIKHDAIYNGLNKVLASETDLNGKQSKEQVSKRAESNRGKKRSQETIALLSKRTLEFTGKSNLKPAKIVVAEHKFTKETFEKSITQMARHFKADYGSFNIDNSYNSYHWVAFKDLDENDLKIMIRDLSEHEYRYELIESGVDIDVFNYLSEKDILNTDDGIYHLDNQTTWKDFKDAN